MKHVLFKLKDRFIVSTGDEWYNAKTSCTAMINKNAIKYE